MTSSNSTAREARSTATDPFDPTTGPSNAVPATIAPIEYGCRPEMASTSTPDALAAVNAARVRGLIRWLLLSSVPSTSVAISFTTSGSHPHLSASGKGAAQGDLVGELQVATHRQPGRQP